VAQNTPNFNLVILMFYTVLFFGPVNKTSFMRKPLGEETIDMENNIASILNGLTESQYKVFRALVSILDPQVDQHKCQEERMRQLDSFALSVEERQLYAQLLRDLAQEVSG